VPASDALGQIKTTSSIRGSLVLPREHARTAVPHDDAGGAELKLELEPGLGLKARLLSADGKPLAKALVAFGGPVQRENTTWHNLPWADRTDDDGRLDLHCLQSGMTLFGFVEVDGVFAPFVHVTPAKDVDLGELRIATSGRISGRVLGPDGPVAGARLLIQTAGDGSGREFAHMAWPSRVARTNNTGAFVVGRVMPGKYRMAAVAPGFLAAFADVTVGDKTPPVEFTLARGGSIAGKVSFADGKPAPGVTLSCWFQGTDKDSMRFGIQPTAESDAQGRFVLAGLPEEGTGSLNAHLSAGEQWLQAHLQTVSVGAQDVELTLSGR